MVTINITVNAIAPAITIQSQSSLPLLLLLASSPSDSVNAPLPHDRPHGASNPSQFPLGFCPVQYQYNWTSSFPAASNETPVMLSKSGYHHKYDLVPVVAAQLKSP